jgi:predicted AlkP superfamily pyrophosphatase or phosphodiesterase
MPFESLILARAARARAACAHVLLAALLLMLAACAQQPSARPAPPARPDPLLLISIDGFHPDYLQLPEAATLRRLAGEGSRAAWMQPSYPSLTFPNHYTLVTGLHPDRHGIINNSMQDPQLGQFATHLRHAIEDGRWWGGEPIWVSAQRQGLRAATLFWPGSEAEIQGIRPYDWLPYSSELQSNARINTVLQWLQRPEQTRPDFLTLYFERVDSIGHTYGPDSPQLRRAVAHVDRSLQKLVAGLEAAGISDRINLLIVSDHGMSALDQSQPIVLDDLLDPRSFALTAYGAMAGIEPRRGRAAEVEAALLKPHPRMRCFRRDQLPTEWQFGQHPRVPSITCQADPPYAIATRRLLSMPGASVKRGGHGYDPALPSMRSIFIGHGPAFIAGSTIDPVRAVDVYALMCRLLGIRPAEHQGDAHAFDAGLRPGR